jgi:8-oxo-dGTP pyrophosphatase MutT (NUDIX family)
MEREHVRQTLGAYLSHFPADRPHLQHLEHVLALSGAVAPTARKSPAHITTGAVLLDAPRQAVLQVRHRHLDRWLLPGGHVERSDRSLTEAARRELTEETGEAGRQAVLMRQYPIDINTHIIPARPERNEGEHVHFDFRFVFIMLVSDIMLADSEVDAFRWASLDALGRVGRRVRELLSDD